MSPLQEITSSESLALVNYQLISSFPEYISVTDTSDLNPEQLRRFTFTSTLRWFGLMLPFDLNVAQHERLSLNWGLFVGVGHGSRNYGQLERSARPHHCAECTGAILQEFIRALVF